MTRRKASRRSQRSAHPSGKAVELKSSLAAVTHLSRRRFLQLTAAGTAATALPWVPGCGDSSSSVAPHYFDAAQRKVIEAMASAISPEDETGGAIGCDVV